MIATVDAVNQLVDFEMEDEFGNKVHGCLSFEDFEYLVDDLLGLIKFARAESAAEDNALENELEKKRGV
jgi:hypothetical protein